MPTTALTCQRDLFSIPAGHCYLNSAYMGPLARPVQQAGIDALARRAAPFQIRAEDFCAPAERTRALCARLAPGVALERGAARGD
jgi:hypothetical protein